MNRIASRLKQSPAMKRIQHLRSETPYIVWNEKQNGWRVNIASIATKFFSVRQYEGSSSRALTAATKWRDEHLSEEIRAAIYSREAIADDAPETSLSAPRYNPPARATNQFALWMHQQRAINGNQQQQ